jgi:Ca2+-binding EF-hand superfamily protein
MQKEFVIKSGSTNFNKQKSNVYRSLPSFGGSGKKNKKQSLDEYEVSADAAVIYEKHRKQFEDVLGNRNTTKGEKMMEFVHTKKLMNPVKYTEKSRINYQALPVSKGTISMMLNVKKQDEDLAIPNFKAKISKKSKFKIKWKTIQWLMDYRKDAINQLCNNYDFLIKFIRARGISLSKDDFYELMSYIGLGAEKPVVEKLFYVLDEDGSGDIDYRELITGLEYFKDSTFEEKLKVFFDICDMDASGMVTKKEIYDVLKRNIVSDLDKMKLKKTIALIFSEVDKMQMGYIEKEKVYWAAIHNKELRRILEESIRAVKKVDRIIENDLEEPYQTWIPISGTMVNFKEGIHFPTTKGLLTLVAENEKLRHNVDSMKSRLNEEFTKLKVAAGIDLDDYGGQY